MTDQHWPVDAGGMPLWGGFGGRCLSGFCQHSADLFLPQASAFGLPRSASFLLGTWRDQRGRIVHMLRALSDYRSGDMVAFFADHDDGLRHDVSAEARLYRGGLTTEAGDHTRVCSTRPGGFALDIGPHTARWVEPGVIDVGGEMVAPPTQWFNPWRGGGGGCAVTLKFRARGHIDGQPVDGFFAHETHFLPPGRNFMDSPYGLGGREIHWGHMATAFADGTVIDASIGIGADGWAFAMLRDEGGRLHATHEVAVTASVGDDGYPTLIRYKMFGRDWRWELDPRGRRADVLPGIASGPLGAEGLFRAEGDSRPVTAHMGTIDWWADGRADPLLR